MFAMILTQVKDMPEITYEGISEPNAVNTEPTPLSMCDRMFLRW